MKTIIMSGFGTYGSYPANVSEGIVHALDAHMLGNYRVTSHVFPATIPEPPEDRARFLFLEARKHTARAIICLAMSSTVKGVTVETISRNRVNDSRYCTPEQIDTLVDPRHVEDNLLTAQNDRWNLPVWKRRCGERNIPCTINDDVSDEFCCNHLMYQMSVQQESGSIPWIFIHVPCSHECLPEPAEYFVAKGKCIMSADIVIRGLELLVESAHI